MLKKKLGFLAMMLLVLMSLSMSASATRSCSGDDCGCGLAGIECRAECNGNTACIRACTKEVIACSKACCSCF